MSKDQILQSLFHESSEMSKVLLKAQREFYPCAFVLNENNKVVPFLLDVGDDFPGESGFIKVLKGELKKDFSTYAIAVNTSVKFKNKQFDAIQIQITYNREEYSRLFIPYVTDSIGNFTYYEVISE